MGIEDCENCDGGVVECGFCGGLGKGVVCKSCTNGVYRKFTIKRILKVKHSLVTSTWSEIIHIS